MSCDSECWGNDVKKYKDDKYRGDSTIGGFGLAFAVLTALIVVVVCVVIVLLEYFDG